MNEPFVRYGPFVMNKREEITEAIANYKNGPMGKIPLHRAHKKRRKRTESIKLCILVS